MSELMSVDVDKDLSKLKVTDLKKELKTRGLSTSGNKSELLDRLQASLQGDPNLLLDGDVPPDSEDILDEDDVLEDDTLEDIDVNDSKTDEDISPQKDLNKRRESESSDLGEENGVVKKIVLNRKAAVNPVTDKENEVIGAEKEPPPTESKKMLKLTDVSLKERLQLRAKKFGLDATDSKLKVNSFRSGVLGTKPEVLQKRAERFGLASAASGDKVFDEKKKKRLERFGAVEQSRTTKFLKVKPNSTLLKNSSLEEKKKIRAERFKNV